MTHDARLSGPVRRAVNYTLRAQDPIGGGWRYKPGDAGDTSQMGWQLMTLKNAELAGIPIPDSTRQGIIRYLQSVASGSYGGRAAYRPSEQPSRTMTAEAMVCWQFLGLSRQNPACNEAGDFLLAELPNDANSNLYYWYYATLAMYQLQGVHWQRWNDALREAVVSRQVKDGPQAGCGTPMIFGAATAAASTPPPWPCSRWKSTTASCRSTPKSLPMMERGKRAGRGSLFSRRACPAAGRWRFRPIRGAPRRRSPSGCGTARTFRSGCGSRRAATAAHGSCCSC